jgi:hypothetical protein
MSAVSPLRRSPFPRQRRLRLPPTTPVTIGSLETNPVPQYFFPALVPSWNQDT